MVISIIGPSGSGKDTQSNLLSEKLKLPNISTGRIMREEIAKQSKLGKQIDEFISQGKWLPDELTEMLLLKRLINPDCNGGFILNGFPRTFSQVGFLDEVLGEMRMKLSAVVHFKLSDEETIARMHKQMSEAEKRPDMNEEAMQVRLASYKSTISPIIEAYEKKGVLYNVDASPSIDEIHQAIMKIVEG